MSGYVERENRISRHRHAQVNLCGDCGTEVSETELLCRDCRCKPLAIDDATLAVAANLN